MSIEIITGLFEAKRAQADAKRREAEILDAEARGLQSALDALRQASSASEAVIGPHMPSQARRTFVVGHSAVGHSAVGTRRTSAGRQPGSLSNKWKRYLLELYESGNTVSKEDVARVVFNHEQRLMKPSEIQRLFENFSRYGHARIVDDGLYVVPEEAVAKFRSTLKEETDLMEESDESDDIESSTPSSADAEVHSLER